jgi:hypothetical protein
MRSSSSRRGQNIIEYVLLATAVTIVLVTGVLVKGGVFVKSTNIVLEGPLRIMNAHQKDLIFVNP